MERSHIATRSRSGVTVNSIDKPDIAQRARSEIEEEAQQQAAFLREESRRLGYTDPDAFLSAAPAAFVALAAWWRDHNPRGHFGQRQQIESTGFTS